MAAGFLCNTVEKENENEKVKDRKEENKKQRGGKNYKRERQKNNLIEQFVSSIRCYGRYSQICSAIFIQYICSMKFYGGFFGYPGE